MTGRDLPIIDDPDDVGLHRNSDVPLEDPLMAGVAITGVQPDHTGLGDDIVDDVRGAQLTPRALREAAVLVPLVQHENQWHILFIRRASNQRDRHSGQVAFPGGAHEAADPNLLATALRETTEEIGLLPRSITLLGELDPYLTISHFRVTPVVGIVQWPATLTLQEAEVARAFLMPLGWLRDRRNFTLRARREMDPKSAKRHPIIVFEPYDGEVLWGATARMTLNLIRAIDAGEINLPA